MNPTQVVGLSACLVAALLCARAARRSSGAPGAWAALTGLYALLTLDIAFDLRLALRLALVEAAQRAGDYGSRQAVQPLLLAGLGLLALLAAWGLGRRLARAGGRLEAAAGLGAAGSLFLAGAEVISLHGVDAVLYRPVGPVILIAPLWAGCAGLVALAALAAARR